MSIQERKACGEALVPIASHGMVAVTEERMEKLLAIVEAAKALDAAFSGYVEKRSDVAKLRDVLAALGAKGSG